ncbi:MAG TPA: hypothetical protein VFZ28_13310 [Burkholderiaceae bacterium]|nr:hypothetical protein [Burkholderiaceae bacterium]
MAKTLERLAGQPDAMRVPRPPMPDAAYQPLSRDTPAQSVRPVAANDPLLPAERTGLDRESARWLPVAVPGFALVVLLVCGVLVLAAAL